MFEEIYFVTELAYLEINSTLRVSFIPLFET